MLSFPSLSRRLFFIYRKISITLRRRMNLLNFCEIFSLLASVVRLKLVLEMRENCNANEERTELITERLSTAMRRKYFFYIWFSSRQDATTRESCLWTMKINKFNNFSRCSSLHFVVVYRMSCGDVDVTLYKTDDYHINRTGMVNSADDKKNFLNFSFVELKFIC